MSNEFNYKILHKHEAWYGSGKEPLGIDIRVSINRPITEADEMAATKACDDLREALELETMRLDPDVAVERELERQNLLAAFAAYIFVEEIPNGYCSRACCSQKPWYVVTTRKGRITIGWRKRVINIAWEPSVAGPAEMLFPQEEVTKLERSIHAWGYDKAKQYVQRLLA